MPGECHNAAHASTVRPGKAADLLDCSRQKVYNLMAAGELPSFKIGRSRRIRVADINAYIDRQTARERAVS